MELAIISSIEERIRDISKNSPILQEVLEDIEKFRDNLQSRLDKADIDLDKFSDYAQLAGDLRDIINEIVE